MKTIKHIILLLFFVNCSTALIATTQQYNPYASPSISNGVIGPAVTKLVAPSMKFESTSSMSLSGTTLPNASVTGVTTTDGSLSSPQGPKRVNPNQPPKDPYQDPLTDAVLCLLLLAAAYGIYLKRKNSIRTPESRHK